MTDPISNYGRQIALENAKTASHKTERRLGTVSDAGAPPKPVDADRVELSALAQAAQNEPAFDREKVDSIRKAIEQGQYAVDPKRIAEQFLAIERMIN
jgi:negative regulator of flagellin synthesis FlgM